jgi:TetR/AcrR family transcriptional regulator, mexJK operon transcriptional repressor
MIARLVGEFPTASNGTTSRTETTRQGLLAAAQRLFLERGFQATSTDAILAEAGVSSKETLYRYFASKEELFVAVLGNLTSEQPDFLARLAVLPPPRDVRALREALTTVAREMLTLICQPSYLALWRTMMAETPRFPQLGAAFFSAIPARGFTLVGSLLREAREQRIIAEADVEAVTRMLLGGLLSYAVTELLVPKQEETQPPTPDRADAMVDVILRAVTSESERVSRRNERADQTPSSTGVGAELQP